MIAHHGVGFGLRATGATLVVDGHDLTLITAGLNSITLITGFVVFAAVRRSRAFDRRLVLSRYRPAALIAAAKTGGALVQAQPSAPMPRSSCCSSGAPQRCGR